jgi:RimJ/RimL family protein N-acetyltransferase
MWQQPRVAQFSGVVEDAFQTEISMPVKTAGDSDRLIRFWLKAANDGWGFRWAIIHGAADEFVGHIGFNSLSDCSEIAFHMNPDFWGNGFMYEAATAAIKWGHDNGAAEIEAFILPDNKRSIALA